ncbi:hypothetical protein MRX96_033134 [Rhipicephalus microplus]
MSTTARSQPLAKVVGVAEGTEVVLPQCPPVHPRSARQLLHCDASFQQRSAAVKVKGLGTPSRGRAQPGREPFGSGEESCGPPSHAILPFGLPFRLVS